MIYRLEGKVLETGSNFAILDVMGVGFQIFTTKEALITARLGEPKTMWCHLHSSDSGLDLYGFTAKESKNLFELLISVSGVGPKSALSILDLAPVNQIQAAISTGKADLLSKAAGIGKKTSERLILELKTKVAATPGAEFAADDADLFDTLIHLGYRREDITHALSTLPVADPASAPTLQDRLKAALKSLSKK